MRVGLGYDIHRLVEGRDLILGGVSIPYYKGLLGHSDADVLSHAVMDAMLGAADLGDIGKHFPDDDERFKDASSIELMKYVLGLIRNRGYEIGNVDSVIMAQAPKMADFIEDIKQNIAKTLDIEVNRVSIKATTTERLGDIGAGVAIAAQAVVLIKRDETEREGLN